jgi:predicted small metal-binding protein
MTPEEWAVLTVDHLVIEGEHHRLSGRYREDLIANVKARIKAAIEEEREACADIVESHELFHWQDDYRSAIADKIRARGEKL